jgi:sporulation protein YlmC with PRC-barrel domain
LEGDVPLIGLVRDVLDNQLVGRAGARIGKVDDIALSISEDGEPPCVEWLEVGGVAPARRFGIPLRPLLAWAARRWGVRKGEPYRIPWSAVQDIGPDIDVDVDDRDTPGYTWEQRILRHIIGRIPGA